MRIEQLTFTRFIAALLIVLFHFARQVPPFDHPTVASWVLQMNTAVSYFYLLSGFIMVISYGHVRHLNWLSYMQNRVARVYPVYLLGFFAMLLLPLLDWDVNIFRVFFGLTLTQSWVPGYAMTYNFPGWSVSVEFFFYAVFPFLLNYGYHRYRFKTLLIGGLLLFIVSQVVFHYALQSPFYQGDRTPSHDILFYGPYMHLNEFVLGNIAGFYFLAQGKKLQGNYDIWILVLLLALVLAIHFLPFLNFHNGLLAPLFLPLIVLLAANTGTITRWFSHRLPVFLGEISYSMYILQLPVFYYLKPLDLGSPVLTFWVKVILHIGICSVCFIAVEKPMRQWIKNINFKRFSR